MDQIIMDETTVTIPVHQTTYLRNEENRSGLNLNKYDAYNSYDLINRTTAHLYLYDHFVKGLNSETLNYQLSSGESFEFEWSLLGLDNSVKFRNLEERLLKMVEPLIKKELAVCKEETYLVLSTTEKQVGVLGSTRLVIHGDRQIKEVLSNVENLSTIKEGIQVLKKRRLYKTDRLAHLGLSCRINVEDTESKLDQAIFETLRNKSSLNYRLIKRQSFIFNNKFRLDLSVVKSGNNVENLLKSDESYEAELEFNPRSLANLASLSHLVVEGLSYFVPDLSLTSLQESMVKWDLYLNFTNDPNFTNSDLNNPLRDLTESWFSKIPDWNQMTDLRPLMSTVANFEAKDLGPIYGSGSYAVTDKSDGIRHWLFINPVGDVFLINVNMGIRLIISRLQGFYSTILDGEYVMTSDGPVFLIFDCLFINGQNFMGLPLLGNGPIRGRIEVPELTALSIALSATGFANEIKNFEKLVRKPGQSEMDAFVENRNFVEQAIHPGTHYATDGVIFSLFQPSYYQIIEGGHYYKTANIKWKPESDLSVDFLVKIERDSSNNHLVTYEEGLAYKTLHLQVSVRRQMMTKATIQWQINPSGQLRCWSKDGYNGDIIDDNTVIECLYGLGLEETGFPNVNWIPIRYRPEKTYDRRPNSEKTYNTVIESAKLSTESYILPEFTKIQGTPNTMLVNPVPRAPISKSEYFGESNIIAPFKKDSYYRHLLNINRVAKFNTLRGVIDRYKQANQIPTEIPVEILDLACGHINDWDTWNCLANITGVDIDESNIQKANKLKTDLLSNHLGTGLKADFFQMDVLRWKSERATQSLPSQVDIITVQFALHFFTGSAEDFQAFLEMILTHLKPGGILLMSTFDGRKLDELLQRKVAVAFMDDNLLWQMSQVGESDPTAIFGQQINSTFVPLRGYRTSQEYLVYLDDRAGKRGIHNLMAQAQMTPLAEVPFVNFLEDEQINYFKNSQHTWAQGLVENIVHNIKKVLDYPNLKAILDNHTVVCYQKTGGPELRKGPGLFQGLDPESPHLKLKCEAGKFGQDKVPLRIGQQATPGRGSRGPAGRGGPGRGVPGPRSGRGGPPGRGPGRGRGPVPGRGRGPRSGVSRTR